MKKVTLILVLGILGLHLDCHSANHTSPEDTCEVLFIGSSYFGLNRLPDLFHNLVISSGKEIFIDYYTPAGWRLHMHLEDSITNLKINERDWDYVVLQGVGEVTAYPGSTAEQPPLLKTLQTFKTRIALNCNSTKMIFCLPWAYEDGMTWLEGWTDEYEEMQIKIYENTLAYSNHLKFVIAPVGWAWYQVLKEKDFPLHYLHTSDWNHPTLEGSYLMACVIYATIYQESVAGNSFNSDLLQEDCAYFQDVASSTVLDSLILWNITMEQDINEIDTRSIKPILGQNYPNPFLSSTFIDYETKEAGFIQILILDEQGRELKKLVNTYQLPGSHTIEFKATNLPAGIYYYSLRNRIDFITSKMVLIK